MRFEVEFYTSFLNKKWKGHMTNTVVRISSLLPTLLILPLVELYVKLYRVVYFLSDFSIFVAGSRQGSLLQVFVLQTITLLNFSRRLAGLLTIIYWGYYLG